MALRSSSLIKIKDCGIIMLRNITDAFLSPGKFSLVNSSSPKGTKLGKANVFDHFNEKQECEGEIHTNSFVSDSDYLSFSELYFISCKFSSKYAYIYIDECILTFLTENAFNK